jgi:hypothetical protein
MPPENLLIVEAEAIEDWQRCQEKNGTATFSSKRWRGPANYAEIPSKRLFL